MRRIWTTLPAALALSAFAIGGGVFETRTYGDDIQDAAIIMNGLGNMARNIGIGAGAARFGTNGVPKFVGGNFNQPQPWGGNQWAGGNPYGQQVIYQPPPMYQPPMYQPPMYQPPMYQQPYQQQVVYQQPVYQQPYQQPVYQQPQQVYQQPGVTYVSGYSGYYQP